MLIDIIAGTRPNFIKIAPIFKTYKKIKNYKKHFTLRLIHTGQHYDKRMSDNFFKDLGIPMSDYNFKSGSSTQAKQTARIMIAYEKLLISKPCNLCIVVGDVNSTMACAISAKKLNIPVAHIEGGLRSKDMSMPEEINRIVTDSISDYFFTTSMVAVKNLLLEGHKSNSIYFVGNLMIDSLKNNYKNLKKPSIWNINKLSKDNYLILTIHRPSNTNNKKHLFKLLKNINKYSGKIKILFPVHPRLKKDLKKIKINFPGIIFTDPQPYLNFMYLLKYSLGVITDSGGITEEATILKRPCLTLRENTERPETVTVGTNILIGNSDKKIEYYLKKMIKKRWKKSNFPNKWDGKTSNRILSILKKIKIKC